jgi:hypothetical protein
MAQAHGELGIQPSTAPSKRRRAEIEEALTLLFARLVEGGFETLGPAEFRISIHPPMNPTDLAGP